MSDNATGAQRTQDIVAADILTGHLPPNSWLRLGALGVTYGVGLSPLREALANLAGRGLVIQDGQRGFRVAPVSLPDLMDLSGTRIVLEGHALQTAIAAGDADWEAAILAARHILSRHPRTPDRLIDEKWEGLHRAFHFAFLAACPSPRMLAACHALYDQFDRYRRLAVIAAGRHPTIAPVETALLDAVLDRDPAAAGTLLTRHIIDCTGQIRALGTPRWFAAPEEAPGTSVARPRRRTSTVKLAPA